MRRMSTAPPPGDPSSAYQDPNQFALLSQRRFAPFFWVQFLGAGNDNLFKFAFTVMVTFQLQVSWLPAEQAGLVIGALFILPYVLFSATSGQLADKLEKSSLIRLVKSIEIAIMALAVWGFLSPDVPVLLFCVFLMGLHSTLFGPVKFAYLPQHLHERELTGGNGVVEMGTFVAILLGNVVGGLLIAIPGDGPWYAALACVAVAVLGRALAQAVPLSPATDPGLKVNWNPFTETWRNLKLARANQVVFRSLLGISWMWFFGAVFLSQFPVYARNVLHGNEQVASLLMVVFSVGVGTGALLCERMSRRQVEIGLVPLGAIGMTVFAVDLYFASTGLPTVERQTVWAFLERPAHWRVMADLALLSLFAGIYSVPMYALIQVRSLPTHRARIIAANNILNALFMIVSALGVGMLLGAGYSVPEVFLVVGLLNAALTAYIFLMVPEYLLRFIAFVLTRLVYRFTVRGGELIPARGAAILACMHLSPVDALLLVAASPRPIRFIMDHRLMARPMVGWLLRLARAIPVASTQEDAPHNAAAIEQAHRVLAEGELLGMCLQGSMMRDEEWAEFKRGIMQIPDRQAMPVVPMAVQGTVGMGRSGPRMEDDRTWSKAPHRGMFSRVALIVGPGVPVQAVGPASLRERLATLSATPTA